MQRVPAAVGALAALVIVMAVSAQSKPDFSGTWKAIASTVQMSGSFSVVQDATTITMSSPSPGGETGRISLKLDGSAGKFSLPSGDGRTVEREATAEWSDSKLVLHFKGFSGKNGAYTTKQTWSIEDGRLVVETVNISDATGAPMGSSGTTTYRKE